MLITIATLLLAAQAQDPTLIDVAEHRDNLTLWSDGHGHYVAARDADKIYYGDGKTFFDASPYTSSSSGDRFEAAIRDQRYKQGEQATVVKEGDALKVTCGKRTTALTKVAPETAKPLISKATFKRPPHTFRPYALARDDRGTYYYVDRGRYDDNDSSFRVFKGPRGNLQEMKLKNIVHDSAGDIFATPNGDLRLIVGDPRVSEWVKDDNRVKLTELPIEDNILLIYNELGVYKKLRLGTPCDDL